MNNIVIALIIKLKAENLIYDHKLFIHLNFELKN